MMDENDSNSKKSLSDGKNYKGIAKEHEVNAKEKRESNDKSSTEREKRQRRPPGRLGSVSQNTNDILFEEIDKEKLTNHENHSNKVHERTNNDEDNVRTKNITLDDVIMSQGEKIDANNEKSLSDGENNNSMVQEHEANGNKKRKSNDKSSTRRVKRQRRPPERLGAVSQNNDDSLFDEIDKENSNTTQSLENSNDENHSNSVHEKANNDENNARTKNITLDDVDMSPGERIIFKMLVELGADVMSIKKHLLEAAVNNKRCDGSLKTSGVDEEKLFSLGLPLTSGEIFDKFENGLKENTFATKVFDVLKLIGGTSGNSRGEIVLTHICRSIFQKDFITTISWTGKSSSKAEKKIPLKKYKRTVKIITQLCLAADNGYTEKRCEQDIIYKVFKYAYRNNKNSDLDNNSSSTESPPPDLSLPSTSNTIVTSLDAPSSQFPLTGTTGPPAQNMLKMGHQTTSYIATQQMPYQPPPQHYMGPSMYPHNLYPTPIHPYINTTPPNFNNMPLEGPLGMANPEGNLWSHPNS